MMDGVIKVVIVESNTDVGSTSVQMTGSEGARACDILVTKRKQLTTR